MIKKREKLKLTEYTQIYKNNDPLLLNLVNKYVLSDLLKLAMVLASEFHRVLLLVFIGYYYSLGAWTANALSP